MVEMKKLKPEELLLTLTDREKDVLLLVCQRKNYQEIAEAFVLTKGTIRTHMFNIYAKLELDHLDRDERVLKIHNTYCPLLQKQSDQQQTQSEIEMIDEVPDTDPASSDEEGVDAESPDNEPVFPEAEQIIEETPELDPISPEDEKMIDDDETALVAYKQEPITGGKKKMGEKKKRGCGRFIFTLILGALMVIGAWYTWQTFLKDMPIVQSIVRLINPDVVLNSGSSAPSSAGSQPSTAETIIESILPKTHQYGDMYEMGEWLKKDDIWIRLIDYELRNVNINFDFEIWNKSGQEIYFSWTPQDSFSMKDNKNNRYEIRTTTSDYKETVKIDERKKLSKFNDHTIRFDNDPIFESGVTDLYITMEYFSKIDKAVFHVALNN
jgi:DNA-binding CsgD family transcriptional regulator